MIYIFFLLKNHNFITPFLFLHLSFLFSLTYFISVLSLLFSYKNQILDSFFISKVFLFYLIHLTFIFIDPSSIFVSFQISCFFHLSSLIIRTSVPISLFPSLVLLVSIHSFWFEGLNFSLIS